MYILVLYSFKKLCTVQVKFLKSNDFVLNVLEKLFEIFILHA